LAAFGVQVIASTSAHAALTPGVHLTQPTDTEFVGGNHTLTATYADGSGNPIADSLLGFEVQDGSANAFTSWTCSPGDCKTAVGGDVNFTYSGSVLGADSVHVWADLNTNGAPDLG